MPTPNTSVKANRINVKNLVYCLLTSDTSAAATYGTVKPLAKAMQVQITPSVATGTLYGDGAQQENISKLNGIAVALDVNKVPIEVRAEILGHTYADGVMVEKNGDQPPYIALGYLVEETNSKKEYVWLLKGSAQPINGTVQQSTDNIVFSTDSMNLNFIPREDGQIRYYADSANADLTAGQESAWFTQGPADYPHPVSTGP